VNDSQLIGGIIQTNTNLRFNSIHKSTRKIHGSCKFISNALLGLGTRSG
jgi:competence transcription factor ComK